MLKDFETISHFYWSQSPTTISVNFWLSSSYFCSDDELIFLCCLKQWVLKPVSKFWDLQNLSTFKSFFLNPTQPQFSYVCLSSWWEVTRISLAFAQKQALVLGRPGIGNSPISKLLMLRQAKLQVLIIFNIWAYWLLTQWPNLTSYYWIYWQIPNFLKVQLSEKYLNTKVFDKINKFANI